MRAAGEAIGLDRLGFLGRNFLRGASRALRQEQLAQWSNLNASGGTEVTEVGDSRAIETKSIRTHLPGQAAWLQDS